MTVLHVFVDICMVSERVGVPRLTFHKQCGLSKAEDPTDIFVLSRVFLSSNHEKREAQNSAQHAGCQMSESIKLNE